MRIPCVKALIVAAGASIVASCDTSVVAPPSRSPLSARAALHDAVPAGGRIVAFNDEWEFATTAVSFEPGGSQLLVNIAGFLAGPAPASILAFSNNFGVADPTVVSTMTNAGYTYTAGRTGTAITLDKLRQYAAVFLADDQYGSMDQQTLIDYVNGGGRVMVLGGTGFGGPDIEAATWNTFLGAFGLEFDPTTYNSVFGSISVPNTAPLFTGVNAFFENNGNDVLLTGSNTGASIALSSGGHGLIGVYVQPDLTPPVVTASVSGTAGTSPWYVSPVTVSWTVSDPESTPSSNCPPVQITTDTPASGTDLFCTATSAGGTTPGKFTVFVDVTAPSVTLAPSSSAYTVDQTVSFTCSATDGTSGVATTSCPQSGPAYTFALGLNTVHASAADKAGNIGGADASFTVAVTSGSLSNLVGAFVSNAGVANSLIAKLKDKSAQAFVNEVNAQTGKGVPADKASILISLAEALLGS